MTKLGGFQLRESVLHLCNQILRNAEIPDEWLHTVFSMIPKKGALRNVKNWRPIALLRIMYKLFSKMLYNRLSPYLNFKLSKDQCAYRKTFSVEDALYGAEVLINKVNEFNCECWMASLDLSRAFDQIEIDSSCEALRLYGIEEGYVELPMILYTNQSGQVGSSEFFDMCRGVRQGDSLSGLLFNVVVDMAFKKWKSKLSTHGWHIHEGNERLNNLRFADDMLILPKRIRDQRHA